LTRPSDTKIYLLLIIPLVAANLTVAVALPFLNQLLFLDMWATATASLLGGPWFGALVGCLTNVASEEFFGRQYLNFTPVSVWEL
jgi:energy-coupling factor transport system substrate-specific component